MQKIQRDSVERNHLYASYPRLTTKLSKPNFLLYPSTRSDCLTANLFKYSEPNTKVYTCYLVPCGVILSPFHFASTGGKIGITIPSFQSSPAAGPIMTWESPLSYPAINGYTLLHEVTFSGFQEKCGKRHRAIMTNSWVGDILHPVDVRGLLRICMGY